MSKKGGGVEETDGALTKIEFESPVKKLCHRFFRKSPFLLDVPSSYHLFLLKVNVSGRN